MSVPNYLAKIKSSGVYRYVFDKSEIPVSERNSIRLVVGYSEKGPFNTPVYFDDANEFIATHGNISRRMERKGIFFNRMALQALSGGPILALNLKPFNVGKKKEFNNVLAFNANSLYGEYDEKILGTALVSNGNNAGGIYDTNRFWKVSENLFDINVMNCDPDTREMGSVPLQHKTYFRIVQTGSHEDAVTIFMRPFKPTNWDVKISEWYSNETAEDMPSYMEAIADTNLSEYFMEIYTFKGRFTRDLFEKDNNNTLGAYGLYPFSISAKADKLNTGKDGDLAAAIETAKDAYDKAVDAYNKAVEAGDEYKSEDNEGKTIAQLEKDVEDKRTALTNAQSAYDTAIEEFYNSKPLDDYTVNKNKDDVEWVKLWKPFLVPCVDNSSKEEDKDDDEDKKENNFVNMKSNSDFRNIYGEMADALDAMSTVSTSNFIGRYAGITFPSFKDANGSFISIDSIFNKATAYHKCLMALDESLLDEAYDADINNDFEYSKEERDKLSTVGGKTAESLESYINTLVSSLPGEDADDYTDEGICGYYVDGFTYNSITKADKGSELVTKILKTLSDYKGLREALTNNVDLDYKYWVDTFQAYPTLALRADITEILQKKFNVLGILNFPPMPDVIAASQNGWARTATGGFDMNSINKDSFISLPTESQGASFAAFYTQLKMTDGAQTFYVPSAALVSNLFMQKRATGQPYNIVAGPNHGRINYTGVIGPDYNYARADLDVLEPFGVNAIIYIPRYGIVINSNQTAKQTPVSALSKVHVRELITYIQDTIQDMLYGYQWELNTPSLRDAIKAKADVILGVVQCNGGIYAYNTKCDDQNNTPEIIDNEMVVLDMEIEPARGAGKMVQTLTIHRTGALSSK